MKLGGVFKKISKRRKKRKRIELDVLESRFKVWDSNLVCVYFDLVVTSNKEQFV